MIYTKEEVTKSTLEYFGGDELATNVFFKYALRSGDKFLEVTPHDMHVRMSKEFFRTEEKYPNPTPYHHILSKLAYFKYIVPQGSPMYGIGNPKPVSLSNCFVIPSPEDNMSSILDAAKNIANLSKRRGGVGLDISKLRPDGTTVNNAAETSSGAWSFADLFSHVGRMIGQGGRRAALMITIDVKHPDVEKFVTMKADRSKVTGANISVRISDEFMKAVHADEDFQLQWPVESDNPTITRTIRAKELWELITQTARDTAEPGILLWDTMTRFLPAQCYPGFKSLSTNPCGEIIMSPDSCRLISQCLKWYVKDAYTDKAYFDFDELIENTKLAMRLSDDLVDLEIEKLKTIIEGLDDKSELALYTTFLTSAIDGRRTGLGTHGLGDALIRMGLQYDSDEALPVIEKIYETIKIAAYEESVKLAKERGAFPVFDWELEKDCEFFKSFPTELLADMAQYGRRNIALLTNAPTGSTSIESQVDCSGLEPAFRLWYQRRRKLDHDDPTAPTFVDDMGDRWIEFDVKSRLVQEWEKETGLNALHGLPDYFVTADKIDWINRVRVQAALSRHIDHSISSTINLPKDVEASTVATIYQKAWELGCKGVTVYREGSRTGVLLSGDEEVDFSYNDAPTRPDELECDIHQVKVKGEDWTILVGKLDGRPYEVMGGKASRIEIPDSYATGFLAKRKNKTVPNRYDLRVNGFKIKDIVSTFDNADNAVLTRMVSMNLRHGVKPSFLVEQLSKDPDASFASFAKVLARVLKRYIEDGTHVASGKEGLCDDGTPHDLIYQEGCVICAKCGWSKC